ncbi:hypothetical protein ACTJKK_02335 [Microbacterium sp. 22179]|uniref:hypothetical protein n=1 Tax=Microbacterium sp. 22179 TaxID=3453886 RepID=UPI003F87FEBC
MAAAPADTVPTSTSDTFGDFTADELANICIDATSSAFAQDVQFDPGNTRIEQRNVEPEWLVLVPARTSGVDGEAQCTIGGSPETPEIELSSASVERLPEAQIQRLIDGENEGGE